jgi:very-short-patch-repair endonuclease
MQQTDLSKARARHLRHTMTPAERVLWHALRNRRFMGLKLRRQVPIGPYIADFYCAEHRLIIEAEAGDHGGGHGRSRDAARDRYLSALDFHVLRLCNADILCNLPGTLDVIAARAQPIDPHRLI